MSEGSDNATNLPDHVCLVAERSLLQSSYGSLRRLVLGIIDEPIRVTLVLPASGYVGTLAALPIRVLQHTPLIWPLFYLSNTNSVADELEESPPRLIHGLSGRTYRQVRQLAEHFDIPYVLHVRRIDSRRLVPPPQPPRCGHLFAGTESIRDYLMQQFPSMAARVSYLPLVSYAASNPNCFADDSRRPCIVASGIGAELEDIDVYLKVARKLIDGGLDAMFFLIAANDQEMGLRRRVAAANLTKELTIIDAQPEMYGMFKGADVFVVLHPLQEMDMSLVEAMAAGLAIVSVPGSALSETVAEKVALPFQRGSVDQLSQRLRHLIDHHAVARALGAAAQQHIKSHHSPGRAAQGVLKIYSQVLGEHTSLTNAVARSAKSV